MMLRNAKTQDFVSKILQDLIRFDKRCPETFQNRARAYKILEDKSYKIL